ncbi:NAD(P)-dependent oxidoreductase [Candidatus Microgenomates bacterium]|nr:MAG: NAD(P)-dependent oxidoreductase [Candidatus Microgenomates bacterium]
MKIAITGAEGFVGRHLTKELKRRGIKYSILDRKKYNLLDEKTLKNFVSNKDIVIHMAGAHRDKPLFEMVRTNILGTLSLVSALNKYSPNAKIIFLSSFMVYVGKDIFGATKKAAEEIIENFCMKSPLKGIVLRFSNIYGKGGRPFSNSALSTFAHLIKKGQKITITGDGSQTRDFLYIDDAVNAIIKSINYNSGKHECIDICTGELTSLNEIIKILSLGRKEKIIIDYATVSQDHIYDIKRSNIEAKEKLNWEPKVFIKEGLKHLL